MRRILELFLILFCASLLYSCNHANTDSDIQPSHSLEGHSENGGEASTSSPSTDITLSDSEPNGEAAPSLQYQPNAALGRQEDPTLDGWGVWDHLEYRLFGSRDEYVKNILEVSRCSIDGMFLGVYQNDFITISYQLPPVIIGNGTVLSFDDGFWGNPLKIGEVFPAYYLLGKDDEPFHMIEGLFAREEFLWDGNATYYDEVYTQENVVGGVYETDRFMRGILPMTRQIAIQTEEGEQIIEYPANHLVRYYVVLDEAYLTYAYFYVSEQATIEDLECYDAIIESISIVP